jgi:hypothetical protein
VSSNGVSRIIKVFDEPKAAYNIERARLKRGREKVLASEVGAKTQSLEKASRLIEPSCREIQARDVRP